MKWTRVIPALWLAGLGLSWAETDRLYLVVAAEGQSTLQSASAHGQVKLLKALKAGDRLDVPKGASLTLTSLGSGQRYQLKGPLQYQVSSNAPSGKNVQVLTGAHDREGIRVSHKVDMSKYGGYTSRTVQTGEGMHTACVNFESGQPIVLDLGLTKRVMNSSGMVQYSPASLPLHWETTSAIVKDHQLTLPALQIPPATTYLIYIEDGAPSDLEAAFAVARLPDDLVGALNAQQSKASDQASLLELYESCRNLRLYWRARELRDTIKGKFPQAARQADEDFKELWAPVEE